MRALCSSAASVTNAPPAPHAPPASLPPPAAPIATVPLAPLLARLAAAEAVSATPDTSALIRRARQHAFEQERRFGGVLVDLSRAVEALHARLVQGTDAAAAAGMEARAPPGRPPTRSPRSHSARANRSAPHTLAARRDEQVYGATWQGGGAGGFSRGY